jgi:hypothetical protein
MRTARANERPIYFRLDTHWTNEGAGVMAKAIVERLAPTGWDTDAVREVASIEHEGDLTVLLGRPSSEPAVELEVVLSDSAPTRVARKLLTAASNEYDKVVAVDFEATGKTTVGGHTLVMHDSYGWALAPMLAPYFQSAAFVAETNPMVGQMQDDLTAAEIIIHVSVQRSLHEIILHDDLAARFLSAFADEFETVEAGVRVTGERLELASPVGDDDEYVVVEMAAGTEEAEVAYADVTAILTADSPRAAFPVGEGGTMFFAGEVNYRLVSVGA